MGLAESAAEGLLATFDPTRDSYLRVQVIFRTLCEWRYDYAGDQTRPSESPESIVIRSFLRTLAERLSRAYLQPPDPSVQHRVREELRATTELSKATASMLASTDPYATRHPLANMCLDIGKYSAAALLQIWSLSSSARIFL